MTAQKLISLYSLLPHPEGGWYKETYKSVESIPAGAISARFGGSRSFSTAIYFLLEQGSFSAFHRIKSDECWHFYAGDPLLIYVINDNGELIEIKLGADIENGEVFQCVIPANHWFASKPSESSRFCFVGCTVAPGFEFEDFELATAETLLKLSPLHSAFIIYMCLK